MRSRIWLAMLMAVAALVSAAPGAAAKQPLGPQFQVSEGGGWNSVAADVAYDSRHDRYLVAWNADYRAVLGRILDGQGHPVGPQFQISAPDLSTVYTPSVAFGEAADEFLVAWGCPTTACAPVAQRVRSDGWRVGDTIRVADRRGVPRVAYNSRAHEYLVVWDAGVFPGAVILGQRLALDGSRIGSDAFQISSGTGFPPGQAVASTGTADVAHGRARNEYLVIWDQVEGDWYTDRRIRAQRLDAEGAQIGADDFVVTGFFPSSHPSNVYNPEVEYDPLHDRYLAAWNSHTQPHGPDIDQTLVTGAGELSRCCPYADFGPSPGPISFNGWAAPALSFDPSERRFYGASTYDLDGARTRYEAEVFAGGHQISTFGSGYPEHDAGLARIVYNAKHDEHLVVFTGNDEDYTSTRTAVQKVFARRLGTPEAIADRRAPRLTIRLKRLQRIVRQRGLILRARCDESCGLVASARVWLPGAVKTLELRRARRAVGAGASAKLKLRTSRAVLKRLRRTFRRRARLTARITVTAADPVGNRRTAKRKIRARR